MAASANDSSCRCSHELPRRLHDHIHSARFGHRPFKWQKHRLQVMERFGRFFGFGCVPAMQLPILPRTLRRLFAAGDFLLPANHASRRMQNRLNRFQRGVSCDDYREVTAPAAGLQAAMLFAKECVLGRADPLRCDRLFIRRTLNRERVGQEARRRLRHMLLFSVKNANSSASKTSWRLSFSPSAAKTSIAALALP